MTQKQVELAETLSKESHQGQKYGPHDYFEYHIKGVVNSLIEHQFSEIYIITALLHDSVEDASYARQNRKFIWKRNPRCRRCIN